MLRLVTLGTVLLAVALVSTIVLATRTAAERAGFSAAARREACVRVGLGASAWLALTAVVASSGALSDFDARPPRLLVVVVLATSLFAVATVNKTASRLLAAAPLHWPIAIQTMRVVIELGLHSLFSLGELPVHLTFEGRNFDIVVGLTAPFVALGVARGLIGRRGAIAWNVASLGLLANIVGTSATTLPGPLHLDWPGVSNAIMTTPPFVWLPAFFVPVALFGHVLSLRQLLAGGDAARALAERDARA